MTQSDLRDQEQKRAQEREHRRQKKSTEGGRKAQEPRDKDDLTGYADEQPVETDDANEEAARQGQRVRHEGEKPRRRPPKP